MQAGSYELEIFSLMCACKCMCFSPIDWGIKNSFCLFGLQYGARGWQKVNTKLIWALIFLMQMHSALCVKVLSEVCTKFNKTSRCVICAQHLQHTNTSAHTRRYERERTNGDTHAHIYAHCEIVKYAVNITNVFEATDQHRVQRCRGGCGV